MLKWTVINKRSTTNTIPSTNTKIKCTDELVHGKNMTPQYSPSNKNSNNLTVSQSIKKKRHSMINNIDKEWNKENRFSNSTPKTKESALRFESTVLRDVSNTPTDRECAYKKQYNRNHSYENKYIEGFDDRPNQTTKSPFTPPSMCRPRSCRSLHKRNTINGNFEIPLPSTLQPEQQFWNKIENDKNTNKNTLRNELSTFEIEYSPDQTRPFQNLLRTNSLQWNNEKLYENCSSIKKSQIANFNDFLFQISSLSSSFDSLEDMGMQFPETKSKIPITPLTNRLADLEFSNILSDRKYTSVTSTEFDKLSLNQMAEAILENTMIYRQSTPKTTNHANQVQEENCKNFEQEKQSWSPQIIKGNIHSKVPEKFHEPETNIFEHKYISPDILLERKGLKRKNSKPEQCLTNNDQNFKLKRQKCIRRKRSENQENGASIKSDSHNMIVVDQDIKLKRQSIDLLNESITPEKEINIDELLKENLEETPLKFFSEQKSKSCQNMLTLPNGIPSPDSPSSTSKVQKRIRKLSPELFTETFVIDPERSQLFGTTLSDISSPKYANNKLEYKKNNTSRIENSTPDKEFLTPLIGTKFRTRRCLSFNSPDTSFDKRCITERSRVRRRRSRNSFMARGSIELSLKYEKGRLFVHVIQCKNLQRLDEKGVNAYVKVSITCRNGDEYMTTKERSVGSLYRTAVHKNSSNPYFDQIFCFDITKNDLSKNVQIAVWHRNKEYRRSEFLGSINFAVKEITKKDINGFFKLPLQISNRLQPISIGNSGQQSTNNISTPFHQCDKSEKLEDCLTINENNLIHTNNINQFKSTIPPDINHDRKLIERNTNMGDFSTSSVEETISLDETQDIVTQDLGKTSSRKKLNEQQKLADENLFLRYLELDPLEGPEAIPAALQRKASGNKGAGRTPFTVTKRLIRTSDSGFGFSVVWTHPPRVERVERGLPADKAGILPGDYIIFVDKHNIVMMPEIDILNLIRSYGNQLTLEVYRKSTSTATSGSGSNQNGLMSSSRSASVTIVAPPGLGVTSTVPTALGAIAPGINSGIGGLASVSNTLQPRPSTVCSINTTSDYNRRRLHLPQVTFSSEGSTSGGANNPEEIRKRTMYQLILREQQYSTAMQFSMSRFVAPLAERTDLLAPSDHRALFQNSQDLLHLTEEILDNIILEDGEPQIHLIPKVYHKRVSTMTALYKKYCTGLKKADCVLANKTRNTNSEFVRFLHNPAIPRRRPDITGFIHKPLEHYREILKLLQVILANTKSNQEDYQLLSKVVHELQVTYRDITSSAGLMEPVGEGRPLLSIQDLESRLVFTRCKPFVLNVPGRQWIFGGDLSRVEGRNVRPYWALLFSDILLFAKVSRDRVLFITEEPLPLINVTEVFFNIRKRATEFRINITPGGKTAESPTAHCGPDLSRTPRKSARRRCVVLRAPTSELKAVWQNLLQKQIYLVHSGIGLTPISSPMDSPDAPITSSVATLQSGDSYMFRRQTSTSQQQLHNTSTPNHSQKHLDELIEHKCRQLGKTSSNKGSAMHLAQWMKGQLGTHNGNIDLSTEDQGFDEPESVEVWSEEELRKRSRELHLLGVDSVTKKSEPSHQVTSKDFAENRCDSILLSDIDGSPSKSTTSGSQVTVRSSPLVPEKVPVCRQCHKTCMSANLSVHHANNNLNTECCNREHVCDSTVNNNNEPANKGNDSSNDPYSDDWGSLMLMGLNAINPTTSLIQIDPFKPANEVPKISVLPPTPDPIPRSASDSTQFPLLEKERSSPKSTPRRRLQLQKTVTDDESPEDSPQTEEPPYLVMVPKNPGLKRYGTWSSLGRIPSDELVEAPPNINEPSSSEEEDELDDETEDEENENVEPITQSIIGWTARAGSFVVEKMAIFEKIGEESRAAIDRYLRPTETQVKSDPETDFGTLSSGGIDDEYENSGATSGEEIWGTPTSGGELDELPAFPTYQGEMLSSPQDSTSSPNCDDEDLIMDELLMAPPMTAAAVRGLLPRRRLEPLLEEDDTESCTTTSGPNQNDTSPSPEQGSEYGDVADKSCVVDNVEDNQKESSTPNTVVAKTPPPPPPRRFPRTNNKSLQQQSPNLGGTHSAKENTPKTETGAHISSEQQSLTTKETTEESSAEQQDQENQNRPTLVRASSYKRIIEEGSNLLSAVNHNNNNNVMNSVKSTLSKKLSSIVNSTDIEPNVIVNPSSNRSKSTRLLEFLSGRRHDDLLVGLDTSYDPNKSGQSGFGKSKQILKLFSRDSDGAHVTTYTQRPFSPRRQNDKQLDRRFWKQLQRRRRNSLGSQIPAI